MMWARQQREREREVGHQVGGEGDDAKDGFVCGLETATPACLCGLETATPALKG